MRRPSLGSSMGSSVIHEISRAIGVLHLLQLARRQPDGVALLLGDFTRAFLERYGDREVPLTVALDVESGVNSRLNQSNAGETVPLLRGMPSPPPESGFQQFLPGDLFERTLETIASGRGELALDDLEFPAVALANTQPLPPAFAVMGSIEAADSVALQQGKFKVLIRHCQGASGAGWMGRFSFGTPELESLLRSYLRTEEAMNPLAVFAEVAHLPQGRAGNVVARPPLRAYEICFLAGSGVDLEHRISLDDLNVSVRNGHIMLRSRRLNREVIPRMTHANNPMAGVHLPHYKFLYMLQFQGEAPLYWHWCELDASPYLPRVVAGKAVLSLARWKISAHLVTAMRGLSPERSRHALREMFTTRRIPRFVTFGTDDQLLTFDVADDYCADSLVTMIVRHSGGTLSEVFPAPDALCATGAAGSYEHEIIVPFLSRQKEHIARPRSVPRNDKAHAVHVPGSKWVFAKIYCGRVTADSQMRESIATLIRRAERLKLIDRWFFIRFSDPDWHIRLRMRARSARGAGQLVQLLHKVTSRSIRCGDIHRIVLDSYDPEVDRYGGAEATNLAEQVFMLDSSAVLEVLSLLPSDAGAADRWLVGLVTVHSILDAFRIPEMHRIGMLESSRDGQLQLLRSPVTPELRQWLSASDRKLRDEVAAAVEGRGFPSRGMARSIEVIGRLKSTLRAPLRQLQRLHETRRLSRPQSEIALSYVHMHLNRLLPFRQNEQEAIIYDLLARYYRSKAARDSSGRSRRDASGQGVNVKST
jgi:thiopeptide-type bacteriocin biosynthesis protein